MTRIFVDTFFYIALLNPADRFHQVAAELDDATQQDELFTSEPVLTEVLDHFAGHNVLVRVSTWEFVDLLRREDRTRIIPQSQELWSAGLDLYRRRPDKGYGLTDCMSMVVCRENLIRSVLTHDHHFAQEWFEILL